MVRFGVDADLGRLLIPAPNSFLSPANEVVNDNQLFGRELRVPVE